MLLLLCYNNPISEQQWLRRVQKTLYHTKLRQLRDPQDSDDMGVAKAEDRVFLTLTSNGFEHAYQTVVVSNNC